jgi:hypothetical protein
MQFPRAEGAKFLSPGRRPCDALGQQPSCALKNDHDVVPFCSLGDYLARCSEQKWQ